MTIENEQQAESTPTSGSRFISYHELAQLAWRRKSHVVMGVVIGLVLGALYYVQKAPVYEAEAQVLVVQKRPEVVTGQQTGKSQVDDFASTHRVVIESPIIIQRAIEHGNLRSLKCLEEEDDLTMGITDRLSVSRVSREAEGVLQISFRGTTADECGIVVNAILDSYKAFLAETYDDMSEDTVALISEARDLLENDLHAKEKEYRTFREDAPLLWNGDVEVNPRQERLTAIELQRSTLLLKKAEYQGSLKTLKQASEDGRSQQQLVALVLDLSQDHSDAESLGTGRFDSSLKSELLPLLLEEKRLLEDYGSNHPSVQAVQQRIATTRNFFALPTASHIASLSGTDGQPDSSTKDDKLIGKYVEYLEREINRIDNAESKLADFYAEEHQEARKLNSYELRDEEFRTDISRTQALYDSLIERLQEANLIQDYGGFEAHVIAPAGKGKKVAPKLLLVTAASLFLGLIFGAGLAYVAEARDKSFRNPEEIRQRLGLPIVGHIPSYSDDPSNGAAEAGGLARDRMLCSYFHPRSTESEAFRSIRTALYFSSGGEDHKVLQVTSPNPGDGKSTVTANLAVCIAMSDKKVLLIDADLRKPRMHKIFDVHSDTGLAAVVGLNVEPRDAILDTGIPNLSLMPTGLIPPDPAEVLSSPRFYELLEVLRQQYDYVLIDSAPVLAVTDPSIVAARVDGVLLTIRISQDGRAHAERAKDILSSVNAKMLGVVVNAIENTGNHSYYDLGYGYGQSEYYGDSEDNGREVAVASSSHL